MMTRSSKIILCVSLAIIGAAGFLVLPLAIVSGTAYFTVGRKYSPEQRQAFKQWNTAPITLPDEALKAKPFAKETIAAAVAYRETFARWRDLATSLTKTRKAMPGEKSPEMFTDADYVLPVRQLEQLSPLVEAFEVLSTKPDYSMEVLAENPNILSQESWPPTPDFMSGLAGAKLLAMEVVRLSREGKHAEALERAETIVRGARTDAYTTIITKLMGVATLTIGTRAWGYAVEHCDEPALLERTIQAQQRLASLAPRFPEDVNLFSYDHIGESRWFLRQGWDVPLQGLTGSQIIGLNYETAANYMEKVVVPALEKDPQGQSRIPKIQKNALGMRQTGSTIGPFNPALYRNHPIQRLQRRIIHETQQEIFFNIAQPNFEEAQARATVAATWFDLLRLRAARKLYRLKEGREAAEAAALVPKYLPEMPEDTFDESGKPLRFEKVDYSVGPDGVDQKAGVVYDPSNGTSSAGDIVLK